MMAPRPIAAPSQPHADGTHACPHARTCFGPQDSIKRYEVNIAKAIDLRPGMKAIDCGCGVGGPMRTIAKASGAHVTGITINEYQARRLLLLRACTHAWLCCALRVRRCRPLASDALLLGCAACRPSVFRGFRSSVRAGTTRRLASPRSAPSCRATS